MSNNNSFDEFVPRDATSIRSPRQGRRQDWRRVELRVSALSAEEWNYLYGLFLADGNRSEFYRGRSYRCLFFLQGDEEELALRVVELLRRAGLRPKLEASKSGRMLSVRSYSVDLLGLLPDGRSLEGSVAAREWFFEENLLFTARAGTPFFSGLLDGDGCCKLGVVRSPKTPYAVINQWHWWFTQSKFSFLVDYVRRFVESVAPGCAYHAYEYVGGKWRYGKRVCHYVYFTKAAILTLLGAGVAKYSWKVGQWLRRYGELRGRYRSALYRVSDAARTLGVDRKTVLRWIRVGKVRCVRSSHWYYVPAAEVERLKKQRAALPRRMKPPGRGE